MQLLAVFAAGTALFAAGCGDSRTPNSTVGQKVDNAADKVAAATERAADKTANAVAKTGDKMDDATITAKVKTALMAEPGLKSLDINVDTRDNNVTLAGTVGSAELKQRATQIAQKIEGVKSVSDQLVVKPS
jgi:osmotically-inducible protein OsmY